MPSQVRTIRTRIIISNLLIMLPEKWFVIRTKENAKVLNEWENGRRKHEAAFLNDKAYFFSDKNYHCQQVETKDYTEITFDQFKQYILREPVNSLYEIY